LLYRPNSNGRIEILTDDFMIHATEQLGQNGLHPCKGVFSNWIGKGIFFVFQKSGGIRGIRLGDHVKPPVDDGVFVPDEMGC